MTATARWLPNPWRAAVVALFTLSGASLPAILSLTLGASDPPMTPPLLYRLFAVGCVLPALLAAALRTGRSGEIEVVGSSLVVRLRARSIEVPLHAITGVVAWGVPLPGPGLWLRLASGRRLGVEMADPTAILVALGAAGVPGATTAESSGAMAHARARADRRRTLWERPLVKFPLFAMLPAGILFYTHQRIAYGGLLGEYHMLGLASYLGTAASHWATLIIYLVLYASVWRAPAEFVCWISARVAPPRAAEVRRLAETACQILYYVGVPVLLALRYSG